MSYSPEETVTVSRQALYRLLTAVCGPPHWIRELQAIRGLSDNPIDTLVTQFNEQVRACTNSTGAT